MKIDSGAMYPSNVIFKNYQKNQLNSKHRTESVVQDNSGSSGQSDDIEAQQALQFIQSSAKNGDDITNMHQLNLDRVLSLIGD